MASDSRKRTLHAFFGPPTKKNRVEEDATETQSHPSQDVDKTPQESTKHFAYPFPIPHLPPDLSLGLQSTPATAGKTIDNQPHLDLLYFEPFIPRHLARPLFDFLRSSLPFYRVEYKAKRGGIETEIRTPRYTTVFGLDETSRFDEHGRPVDAATRTQVQKAEEYLASPPRPIPQGLDALRVVTEKTTGCRFNICLVNYYASGADSVSYHSDDERFLGPMPVIASFSLGAKRDFCLKHKPFQPDDSKSAPPKTEVVKLPLGSGDLVLMRGQTQAHWLHSIPKRAGKNLVDGGRINITFRKALSKGGTANYYAYNVGSGPVYRWDEDTREMKVWKKEAEEELKQEGV